MRLWPVFRIQLGKPQLGWPSPNSSVQFQHSLHLAQRSSFGRRPRRKNLLRKRRTSLQLHPVLDASAHDLSMPMITHGPFHNHVTGQASRLGRISAHRDRLFQAIVIIRYGGSGWAVVFWWPDRLSAKLKRRWEPTAPSDGRWRCSGSRCGRHGKNLRQKRLLNRSDQQLAYSLSMGRGAFEITFLRARATKPALRIALATAPPTVPGSTPSCANLGQRAITQHGMPESGRSISNRTFVPVMILPLG